MTESMKNFYIVRLVEQCLSHDFFPFIYQKIDGTDYEYISFASEMVDAWTTFQITEYRRCGLDFFENSGIRLVTVFAYDDEDAKRLAMQKFNGYNEYEIK